MTSIPLPAKLSCLLWLAYCFAPARFWAWLRRGLDSARWLLSLLPRSVKR